jgi:hypothetical protein
MSKKELEDKMLALELGERKALMVRLGVTFIHAYMKERVAKSGEPRRGQFKENAHEVLRHKVIEVAERAHFKEGVAMCDELSYVMAALAGEPNKEILVIGSAGAAAYVSFSLLKSMGWECQHTDAGTRRHSYNACKSEWITAVKAIPVQLGTCFRYARLLTRTWRAGIKPDLTEWEDIQKKHGTDRWFRRCWP